MRPYRGVVSNVAVLVLEDAAGIDSGEAVDLGEVSRNLRRRRRAYVELSAKRSEPVVFPVLWQNLLL